MEGTVHKLEDKFPFNTRQLAMFMYDKYLEDLAEDIESSSSEYESDS